MTPTPIKYPAGSLIILNVTNADNLLVGYLEESSVIRRQIYGRMTDYAITFRDSIDVSSGIRTDDETLTLIATNFSGGGVIAFTIVVNETVKETVSVNLAEYTSQVWAYRLQKV